MILNKILGGNLMVSIMKFLNSDTQYYTCVQMLKLSGIIGILYRSGPFTVFVPNNDAFGDISSEKLTKLLKRKARMKSLILSHIISGKYTLEELKTLKSITTLSGLDIRIESNEDIFINEARVVASDIPASNGLIHIIDSIIKVPEIITAL